MTTVILNEQILDTLANVAITLAAFSGLVVTFRTRGVRGWSPTELRVLWLLIVDSFLVAAFALLPVPLALAGWSADAVWGVSSGLLGLWFFVGVVWSLIGEARDRSTRQWVTVPWFTTALYCSYPLALGMGGLLWLSVGDLAVNFVTSAYHAVGLGAPPTPLEKGPVPRGQALYVAGLILLLGFAALEFMYFIGLMSRRKTEPRDGRSRPV